MSRFMRNVHRLAVVTHLVGVAVFSLAYSVAPHWGWPILAGWAVWYGAQSLLALRADRKRGV